MGAHIQRQARALGLPVLIVDGSRTLDEVAALVEARFAARLADARSGA